MYTYDISIAGLIARSNISHGGKDNDGIERAHHVQSCIYYFAVRLEYS